MHAVRDLVAIQHWQMQPGHGPRAIQRLQRIRQAVDRLTAYPSLGTPGAHPGTRELFVAGGHCVVYRLDPDTNDTLTAGDVLILRIFGPGQSRNVL